MNGNKRFKTKIDWWLATLLCVSPLISLLTLLGFYLLGISYAWLSWLGVLIVGLIYAGLIFPLYYEHYNQCDSVVDLQVTIHLYRYAVRGYSYLVSVTEPAGTLSTKFSTDQSTALDLTAKFNRRF